MSGGPLSIGVFAAVPPPIHGSTYAAELLLGSSLGRTHRLSHVNTAYATSLANTGKPEVRKAALMLRYLWRLVREDRREHFAYVIVAPAFTLWPCVRDMLCILVIRAATQARIVAWSHSNDARRFYDGAPGPVRLLMRTALRRVAHVVTAGDSLRYNFIPFVGENRVSCIPNGLPARAAAEPKLADGVVRLIFFSGMLRAKGWQDLLRAAEIACATRPGLIVTFYGAPGLDSPAEEIQSRFASCSCPERIRWEGPVSTAAKVRVFDQSDVLCLPSFSEAAPMAILEAMQAGLAVIATGTGAVPEMVVDGRGGLIVPAGDPDALAQAIGRLADDADLRARMGAFNRARFEERFAMDRVAERWLQLFETLERSGG